VDRAETAEGAAGMTTTAPTALVLGATGGIGGAVTRRLRSAGWTVRALSRDPDRAARRRDRADGVDWRRGDALAADDVAAAAAGVDLVVHAVNPPGYRDWDRLVLPMLDNTLAAAQAAQARVLLPGTVYNFGPDAYGPAGTRIGEDAAQAPTTRKGRIRVEMERRLERAAAAGDVRVLIVRAGDYFGPTTGNGWFGQIVTPGRRPRRLTRLGAVGVGHQWAYLPDVADTMVRLLEQPDLPDFARFHIDGHWDPDGEAIAAAIRRVLGRPDLRTRAFPWPLVRLASPVVPLFREILEMRYLWREPVRLANARLVATLGAEPRTPLDTAIAATLTGLGCV
jgi:nucleoside-diphosphate-sugar epimerase